MKHWTFKRRLKKDEATAHEIESNHALRRVEDGVGDDGGGESRVPEPWYCDHDARLITDLGFKAPRSAPQK